MGPGHLQAKDVSFLKGNNEMWWHMPCQAWWYPLVILALGRSREDDQRSEASLGYIKRSVSEKKDEGEGKGGGRGKMKEEKEEGRKTNLIAKSTEIEQIYLPNPEVKKVGIYTTVDGCGVHHWRNKETGREVLF